MRKMLTKKTAPSGRGSDSAARLHSHLQSRDRRERSKRPLAIACVLLAMLRHADVGAGPTSGSAAWLGRGAGARVREAVYRARGASHSSGEFLPAARFDSRRAVIFDGAGCAGAGGGEQSQPGGATLRTAAGGLEFAAPARRRGAARSQRKQRAGGRGGERAGRHRQRRPAPASRPEPEGAAAAAGKTTRSNRSGFRCPATIRC